MDGDVGYESLHLDQFQQQQEHETVEPVQFAASAPARVNLDSLEHEHASSAFIDEGLIAETSSTYLVDGFSPRDDELLAEGLSTADRSSLEISNEVLDENEFLDVAKSIIAEHVDAIAGDDIEWVECEEEESSSLALRWRILLAMIAITLVAAFFYILEKRRQKQPTPNGDASAAANKKASTSGGVTDREKDSHQTHWEKPAVDPLTMAGIDFVSASDGNSNLKMDTGRSSPSVVSAMIMTTPGGTDHWDADFFLQRRMKAAKDTREEVDELPEHRHGAEEENREVKNHDRSEEIDSAELIDRSDTKDESKSEEYRVILAEELLHKLVLENPPSDHSLAERESANIWARPTELIEVTILGRRSDQLSTEDQVPEAANGVKAAATDFAKRHESSDVEPTDNVPNGKPNQPIAEDADHIDAHGEAFPDAATNGEEVVITTEYVDIHSKSESDSVHAAAVGDDYDRVTIEVQLTTPRSNAWRKENEPDQAVLGVHPEQAVFLDVIVKGRKEPSASPALEDQVVDLVGSVIPQDADLPIPAQGQVEAAVQEEAEPSSASRSEDQLSLCEHTTAPEIETCEVSDVELEQEDEAALEPAVEDWGEANEGARRGEKKNGSPPVILAQVTAVAPAPGRRRAHGGGGVRLLKVETVDEQNRQKIFAPAFVNGNSTAKNAFSNERESRNRGDAAADGEDDEESAKMSSVFEVIGARSMNEALIKMETLEAVTRVMRLAGLESSNLIFGIDYTASNKYQGEISFGGESLHKISDDQLNPYQQVITIMGQTLAPFAKGGYIPAYGFGDVRTSDTAIFPLKSSGYCKSFAEVLEVYNRITPKVILSGPTNFAPLIYQSMEICKEFKCYHILVIVADGQVTNERATRRAIVDACRYPLSIIVVGVGDGPWDMMRIFDERLPKRPWDNFHFVEFYKVTLGSDQPDLAFAVQSLLEIPDQYKRIKALGLLEFC